MKNWLFVLLRIFMGFIFLWAFLDKLFGLDYSTPRDRAWMNGGSPTAGFLQNSTGPLQDLFRNLAGNMIIDWVFMAGLLLIGLGLMLGVFMQLAAFGGVAMMVLIYLAAFPPEHNPFLDEHLVYALVLVILSIVRAGRYFSLGRRRSTGLF